MRHLASLSLLVTAECSMKMSNKNGVPPGGTPGVDAPRGTTTDGSGGGNSRVYTFLNFDGPGTNTGGTVVDGISSTGAIVGFSTNAADGSLTNFIRKPDGTFTLLGLDSATAVANSANRAGNVVGVTGMNAFLYSTQDQLETTLAPASPGNTTAEIAFGINDHGAIVGQDTKNDGSSPGFLLINHTFTTISPPNAMSVNAQGVNNNGLVVGFSSTAAQLAGPVIANNPEQHGFLFDSVMSTYSTLPDPNVQGLFLTQYLGINDVNQAVGYWQDMAGNQHGVIYDPTTNIVITLDSPDARPSGGVSVTQIVGISNSGELAGFYLDANGVSHGFYAMPQ
jgi:hypothetical protein